MRRLVLFLLSAWEYLWRQPLQQPLLAPHVGHPHAANSYAIPMMDGGDKNDSSNSFIGSAGNTGDSVDKDIGDDYIYHPFPPARENVTVVPGKVSGLSISYKQVGHRLGFFWISTY